MKKTIATIASAIALAGCTPTAVAAAGTACPPDKTWFVPGYPNDFDGEIKSPGGIFPWENGGYNHGQEVGAANTVAVLDAFAAACPESAIYLHGHSYGAGIVDTATETLDGRDYADRVEVYVTGSPRRPGGVEDTYQGPVAPGIHFRGPVETPQNLGSYTSVCNPRDGVCDMPHLLTQPIQALDHIAGYFTGAHRY